MATTMRPRTAGVVGVRTQAVQRSKRPALVARDVKNSDAEAFNGWSAHVRYFLARYPLETRHFVAQRLAIYGIRSLLSSHRQEDLTLDLLASTTDAADRDVLAMMKQHARQRQKTQRPVRRGGDAQQFGRRQQDRGTGSAAAIVNRVLRERESTDNVDVRREPRRAPATSSTKHPVIAARPDVLTRYPFVDNLMGAQGGGVGGALHQATPATPVQNLAKREIRRLAHEVFRELKASALGIKLSDLPSALQFLFFGDSASLLTSTGGGGAARQQVSSGRTAKDLHLVMDLAREALPSSFALAARDVSTLGSASTHGGRDAAWVGGGQTMFISERRWIKLVAHIVRRLWEMDGTVPPPPRTTLMSAAAAASSMAPYATTFQQPEWRPVGNRAVGARDVGGTPSRTRPLGGWGGTGYGVEEEEEEAVKHGLSSLGSRAGLSELGFTGKRSDGFSSHVEPTLCGSGYLGSVSTPGAGEVKGGGRVGGGAFEGTRSSVVIAVDEDDDDDDDDDGVDDAFFGDAGEDGGHDDEVVDQNSRYNDDDHESLLLREWEEGGVVGGGNVAAKAAAVAVGEEWVGAGRSMAFAPLGADLNELSGVRGGLGFEREDSADDGDRGGEKGPRTRREARDGAASLAAVGRTRASGTGVARAKRSAAASASRRASSSAGVGEGGGFGVGSSAGNRRVGMGEKEGTRGAGMWEVTLPRHVSAAVRAESRRSGGGAARKVRPHLRGVRSRIGPQVDAHRERLRKIAKARDAAVRDVVARRRLAELETGPQGDGDREREAEGRNVPSSRGHSAGQHALDIAGAFLESSLMTRLAGGDWFDDEGGISGEISKAWEPDEAVKVPPHLRHHYSREQRTADASRRPKPCSPRLGGRSRAESPTRVAAAARRAYSGWLGDYGPVHTHTVKERHEASEGDGDQEDDDEGGRMAESEGGIRGQNSEDSMLEATEQGGEAMYRDRAVVGGERDDEARAIAEGPAGLEGEGSAAATAVRATIPSARTDIISTRRYAAASGVSAEAAVAGAARTSTRGVGCGAPPERGGGYSNRERLDGLGDEQTESAVRPLDGGLDAYLQLATEGAANAGRESGNVEGGGPGGGAPSGAGSGGGGGGGLLAPGSAGSDGSAGGYTGATTGSWWEEDRSALDGGGDVGDGGGLEEIARTSEGRGFGDDDDESHGAD